MEKSQYGRLPDGQAVGRYVLRNHNGMEAEILTLGGALNRLLVPGREGSLADVVLGFDDLASRMAHSDYQGELVGRFANRIAGGRFTLKGVSYQLPCNDKTGCLHGCGELSRRVWQAQEKGENRLALSIYSHHGSNGFPGCVTVRVVYTLTQDNMLEIVYSAKSDRDTIISLTNHAYFNLAGFEGGDVLSHMLEINADAYLPLNEQGLPTGEVRPVAGTPFDFRAPKRIGRDLLSNAELEQCGGYDHNYCLAASGFRKAARAWEPQSGRAMTVYTDMPGMQLYIGNALPGHPGKNGVPMGPYSGFCLETQQYPDSPNRPEFPSSVLRPGDAFVSSTRFAFTVE